MELEEALNLLWESGLYAEQRLCGLDQGHGIFVWNGTVATGSGYTMRKDSILIAPEGEKWRIDACLDRDLMPLQAKGLGSLEETVERVVSFFKQERSSSKLLEPAPISNASQMPDECLAHVVLRDSENWIGSPDPVLLDAFLHGARDRALLTKTLVPEWRITGPLELKEFYLSLVARTGHPSLSIRWAHALEFLYYSRSEGMRELLARFEEWIAKHGLVNDLPPRNYELPGKDLTGHLCHVARRPGMYFGKGDGCGLGCYLAGMGRGGDWLGLPVLEGLREVIDGIEQRSFDAYGSRFGAYRAYNAPGLLAWVGIAPIED